MYNGDQARKKVLIEHGFRLLLQLIIPPQGREFWEKVHSICFCYARRLGVISEGRIVEQVIRPTGVVDPESCASHRWSN